MKTLYICYFGLREPLVQTQVLPYLRELARGGVGVSLLTFEPEMSRAWGEGSTREARERLNDDGIDWHALPYHKRPSAPATVYDILAGAWKAARLVRRRGIDVLHARAHVPMAMALLARRLAPCRTVFDVRGLMAEEYADAGVWREGSAIYRAVKWLERAGLRRADQVVVLTERMRAWLAEGGLARAEKITVIPCCVGLARFAGGANVEGVAVRNELEETGARVDESFEVVYAGAATGLYLLEEMGRFFLAVRELRPRAFLRVLTRSDAGHVSEVLRRAGLSDEEFGVGPVEPSEVPVHLKRARLGLSFRKPTFSQMAASPTKIPEYLAAGLPAVSNARIGDTDELLERERVGVVVRGFTREDFAEAAARAVSLAEDSDARARCAEAARRHFDLVTVGGARYLSVYRRIAAESGARVANGGARGARSGGGAGR
ncbi:MAG TPA: glycosyltransferase [Pyrinomonadaceae bacterium]|nr:glycosyltransferase [Pyrinomonadaceae bacterium]